MLGNIFEKLLDVNDRKSKGSFYTPREIVHYMCQESLANYLVNKVGVDYREIKEFIQYGEIIRDYDLKNATENEYKIGKTIFNNIKEIDKALENVKIADPAVGSGAFPLGILNEIVKLRDILTSYLEIYCRIGKLTINDISDKRTMFDFKWNAIKNNIYGVDIENSAVDITKLRLWLSIVVDQEGEPVPLPNLNCKIMQGNSLVDEYEGIKLIDSKFIEELKDRDNVKFNSGNSIRGRKKYWNYDQIEFGDFQEKAIIDNLIDLKQKLYGESDSILKKRILDEIQSNRMRLLEHNFAGTNKIDKLKNIDKSHKKSYFAWMLEFIEVFIENDGFDIVIGNPPYVDYRKIDNITKEYLNKNSKSAKISGMASLYIYFIEKGINLFNKSGYLIYINPYQYLNADSGYGIRNYIFKNKININKIIDVSNMKIFKNADTYTCINSFDNNISNNIEIYKPKYLNKIENNKEILKYDLILEEDKYKIILNKNEIVDKMDNIKTKLSDFAYIFCGNSKSGMKKILINKEDYNNLLIKDNYVPYVSTSDFNKFKYNINKYVPKSIYSKQLQEIFENNENLFFGRMTKDIRVVKSNKGIYCGKVNCLTNLKCDRKILWAILNSDLILYYYKTKNETKHLSGGYFGMDIPSIEEIPIKLPNKNQKIILEQYIDNYNSENINKVICDIYEIDYEKFKKIIK